jgi:tetratricopeptide (TPR) repeat protein
MHDGHDVRGITYGKMGRYEEALADFDHSLKVGSNFAAAHIAREQILGQRPPRGKTWDQETLG